jgi:UDP-N-acetylglucosamine 2-epimerase
MILIYYANRAEKSILDPIKTSLDRYQINNMYINLSELVSGIEEDKNLSRVYDAVFEQVKNIENCKCAIVIGDRREIMFASLALFVNNIPIVQLASGDLSEEISLVDDYFRHLITILSSTQVGFTEKSKEKSDNIMSILNLKNNSAYFPNPSLSDITLKIDNDSKKYDLILVHPQSLSEKGTSSDAKEVLEYFNSEKMTVVIKGNKDKNYEILYSLWQDLESYKNVAVYENLKKEDFIKLLANCDRFITNSSCSFYEAPIFLSKDQIFHIGNRNKNREEAKYTASDIKSSDKIVKFIMSQL